MRSRFPAAAGAVLALVLCGRAACGDDLVKELQALARQVRALRAIRDGWAQRLAAASPDETTPTATSRDGGLGISRLQSRYTGIGDLSDGCLVLAIEAAVDGKDMEVQVLRRSGQWTGARARCSGLNPVVYPADGAGLVLKDGRLTGRLTVRFVPWSWAPLDEAKGVPVDCVYRIDAAIAGAKVLGQAVLDNPTAAPLAGGARVLKGRWVAPARPVFPEQKDAPLGTAFEGAAADADEANRLYEQIRAMALGREAGLPYEVAIQQVARCRTTYADPGAKPRGKGADGPGGPRLPGIEDDLGLGLQDVDLGSQHAKDEAGRARTLEAIAALRRHVERLIVLARAVAEGPAGAPPAQTGDADCPDGDFGPWSACAALPRNGSGVHLLPDDAGEAGPPSWPCVGGWNVLGPFPLSLWPAQTAALPDIVPDFKAQLRVEVDRLPGVSIYGRYHGSGVSGWVHVEADKARGRIIPPAWMIVKKYPGAGKDWSGFYAVSEVHSPRDGRLWAAVQMSDGGCVWANDRLVWVSGDVGLAGDVNTFRFPIPLRKGLNRLMVRCDSRQYPHFFAFRICTSGRPHTAGEVKEAWARRDEAYAKLDHPLKGTVGWRNDQSGRFPDARPVLAWDLKRGVNVLWRTPLPTNNGSLTVSGGRVFTLAERFTLLCLDKMTGEVLWRREVDPLEATDPQAFAEAQDLRRRLAATKDEAERRGLTSKLARLYWTKAGVQMEVRDSYTGNAMATPVTDGRSVWVKMGRHAIACYLFDGNRRWLRSTESEGGGMGHPITSPVLLSGRSRLLICQVPRYPSRRGRAPADQPSEDTNTKEQVEEEAVDVAKGGGPPPDRHPGRRMVLRAWRADTGEPLWTTRAYSAAHVGNRFDADGVGTPHPMRLTNGSDTLDVIVTSGGAVFRADDGACLLEHLGVNNKICTPVDDGRGTVFLAGSERGDVMSAARLILRDRDRVEAQVLWSRHWTAMYGGWLLDGGLLYGFLTNQVGSLLAMDPATGRFLWRRRHLLPVQAGHPYPPPTLAGPYLFCAEDGRCQYNRYTVWKNPQLPPEQRQPFLPAGMSAVQLHPEVLVLARNFLEGMTMAPAFDGERMYARTRESALCIGYTGDEGRHYEAETVARTVLSQMQIPAPTDAPALSAVPLATRPDLQEIDDLEEARVLTGWSFLGPLPAARSKAAAEAAAFPAGSRLVTAPPKSAIAGADVQRFSRSREGDYPPKHMARDFRFGATLDVLLAHQGRPGTVGLWSEVLHNDRRRTVRLDLDCPQATLWIAGQAVAHNQRIRLERGYYVVSMRTAVPDPAPAWLTIRPRLWPSNDVTEERRRRLARIRQAEPFLRKAMQLVPLMKTGGFIPSVDHQTPPGVSLEQYRVYLRLLNEYTAKL